MTVLPVRMFDCFTLSLVPVSFMHSTRAQEVVSPLAFY